MQYGTWVFFAAGCAAVFFGCHGTHVMLPKPPPPADAAAGHTDSGDAGTAIDDAGAGGGPGGSPSGRGFPAAGPWVSFYGPASKMGDLTAVASHFRVINIDTDPGGTNFTAAEIAILKANGQNRVISYFNIGSCEKFRSYFKTVPTGYLSCSANTAAQLGSYTGYPDEIWMNPANADWARLVVEHIAPRLAATGVDGFFFDNLELLGHGTATKNGPCDAACSQAGLDLVRRLRERFPDLLFVMQNGTGDYTRNGTTGGLSYPALLDGISHEEVYQPYDSDAEGELLAWQALKLMPGGKPFFIGTEDYVGNCSNMKEASAVYEKSRSHGFSPYASDKSAGQQIVCLWPF